MGRNEALKRAMQSRERHPEGIHYLGFNNTLLYGGESSTSAHPLGKNASFAEDCLDKIIFSGSICSYADELEAFQAKMKLIREERDRFNTSRTKIQNRRKTIDQHERKVKEVEKKVRLQKENEFRQKEEALLKAYDKRMYELKKDIQIVKDRMKVDFENLKKERKLFKLQMKSRRNKLNIQSNAICYDEDNSGESNYSEEGLCSCSTDSRHHGNNETTPQPSKSEEAICRILNDMLDTSIQFDQFIVLKAKQLIETDDQVRHYFNQVRQSNNNLTKNFKYKLFKKLDPLTRLKIFQSNYKMKPESRDLLGDILEQVNRETRTQCSEETRFTKFYDFFKWRNDNSQPTQSSIVQSTNMKEQAQCSNKEHNGKNVEQFNNLYSNKVDRRTHRSCVVKERSKQLGINREESEEKTKVARENKSQRKTTKSRGQQTESKMRPRSTISLELIGERLIRTNHHTEDQTQIVNCYVSLKDAKSCKIQGSKSRQVESKRKSKGAKDTCETALTIETAIRLKIPKNPVPKEAANFPIPAETAKPLMGAFWGYLFPIAPLRRSEEYGQQQTANNTFYGKMSNAPVNKDQENVEKCKHPQTEKDGPEDEKYNQHPVDELTRAQIERSNEAYIEKLNRIRIRKCVEAQVRRETDGEERKTFDHNVRRYGRDLDGFNCEKYTRGLRTVEVESISAAEYNKKLPVHNEKLPVHASTEEKRIDRRFAAEGEKCGESQRVYKKTQEPQKEKRIENRAGQQPQQNMKDEETPGPSRCEHCSAQPRDIISQNEASTKTSHAHGIKDQQTKESVKVPTANQGYIRYCFPRLGELFWGVFNRGVSVTRSYCRGRTGNQ